MAEPLRLRVDRVATPIGDLAIVADESGRLRAVEWTDHDELMQRALGRHCGAQGFSLHKAVDPGGLGTALAAYFAGDLAAIDTMPVATFGTEFQRIVWRALRKIPCGETISYAALARRIGRATAIRAVGLANGSNPVSVVVPCHRVIGSDGSLTGYGGGIERKRWLLAHEQRAVARRELSRTLSREGASNRTAAGR